MILCEVQEYSDLTYRIYDYGRLDSKGKPRQLHIEKALAVIDFSAAAKAKVETRALHVRGEKVGEPLVDCPYFSTFKHEVREHIHFKVARVPREQFQLWIFLQGAGKVGWTSTNSADTRGGEFSYKPGECWFLPAEFGSHGLYPQQKTSILMAAPGKAPSEPQSNN